MIPYLLVLVMAFGSAPGASQFPDAAPCKLLTAEDVIGVFGAKPTTQGIELMPGICEWSMLSVSLTVTAVTMPSAADAAQRVPDVPKSNPTYTYRFEPGVGDRAMSVINSMRDRVELTVVKGTRILGFEVKGRTTKLDPDVVLPRLRTLARRLLERAPALGISQRTLQVS